MHFDESHGLFLRMIFVVYITFAPTFPIALAE